MNSRGTCSILCVLKHDTEKSCPLRHIQCPFVQCEVKVVFKDLHEHLWKHHGILLYPTNGHSGTLHVNPTMFHQNYVHRPFSMMYEEKVFIVELCRKNDTGLWHLWVFAGASPKDACFYSCKITIGNLDSCTAKDYICYRGPVISVDIGFKDVVRSGTGLVIHDTAMKRFARGSPDGVRFTVELNGEFPGFDVVTVDSVGVDEMSMLHLGSQLNTGFDDPVFPSAHQNRVFDTKTIKQETVGVFPKKTFVPAFKSSAKLYPDSQKIFVGNIPPECSNDDIKQAFSKYGQIVDFFPIDNSLHKERLLSKSSNHNQVIYNCGFLVFKEEKDVAQCLQEKNHRLSDGRFLVVAPKTPAPHMNN